MPGALLVAPLPLSETGLLLLLIVAVVSSYVGSMLASVQAMAKR